MPRVLKLLRVFEVKRLKGANVHGTVKYHDRTQGSSPAWACARALALADALEPQGNGQAGPRAGFGHSSVQRALRARQVSGVGAWRGLLRAVWIWIHPVLLPVPLSSAPSFPFFPRGSVRCPIPSFSHSFLCPAPHPAFTLSILCLLLHPSNWLPIALSGSSSSSSSPYPTTCPLSFCPAPRPSAALFCLSILLFAFPALCPPLQPSLSLSVPLFSSSPIHLPPSPSFPLFYPISLSEFPSLFFSPHLSGQLFIIPILFPSL